MICVENRNAIFDRFHNLDILSCSASCNLLEASCMIIMRCILLAPSWDLRWMLERRITATKDLRRERIRYKNNVLEGLQSLIDA